MEYTIILLILYAVTIYAIEKDSSFSFQPPFKSVNPYDGHRHISGYRIGGDATIHDGFVRLTPDKRSKSGYLTSEIPIYSQQFILSLKFRISGKGNRFFGDGLALTLQKLSTYSVGNFFGTKGVFSGISIAFDTFKNTENSEYHKDVSLFYNNGDYDLGNAVVNVDGCDSSFRFSENRGDFNINNYAEARIAFDFIESKITIYIDGKGTGTFANCTESKIPDNQSWMKNPLYATFSAATGELSDNHDIISFYLYNNTVDINSLPNEKMVSLNIQKDELDHELNGFFQSNNLDTNSLNKIERALFEYQRDSKIKVDQKISDLDHHLEHQLTEVKDNLNVMIDKLKDQDSSSQNKLGDIEELVKKLLNDKMNKELEMRLSAIENSMKVTIKSEVKSKSSLWMIPFFILSLVFVICTVIAISKYRNLHKSHIL